MERNLTGPLVGFHIKLHQNTHILTLQWLAVVPMPRKPTIALTSSAKFSVPVVATGFSDLKLL